MENNCDFPFSNVIFSTWSHLFRRLDTHIEDIGIPVELWVPLSGLFDSSHRLWSQGNLVWQRASRLQRATDYLWFPQRQEFLQGLFAYIWRYNLLADSILKKKTSWKFHSLIYLSFSYTHIIVCSKFKNIPHIIFTNIKMIYPWYQNKFGALQMPRCLDR